jgi:hypothetical protein
MRQAQLGGQEMCFDNDKHQHHLLLLSSWEAPAACRNSSDATDTVAETAFVLSYRKIRNL